ncbi:MAG: NADH-quinone oxidoreductase subunit N [Tannerella sp.]|jgi:NADH-quinone oxidoreductase subunit N|nr:NADH-quinone oxidoreductase subunit N [Tannerella sp.]
MDYGQFLNMHSEISLILVIFIMFFFDLFASGKARNFFPHLMVALMGLQVLYLLIPVNLDVEIFGGMYRSNFLINCVKIMLAFGTIIVLMQSNIWLKRDDTRHKQGEFYTLLLFTLLGMFFMVSSGNFLVFVIGLELATIPMACLIAFDKYKHISAEAGAKFILSAMFSSGVMMFGISYLYATTGTLYFNDMVGHLTGTPLQIMALVFFFAGLGFKLSLVPFHLWTPDVYQGAPTNVTAYLSVVSKGAAAFALMIIFIKVFAPMIEIWQEMLFWVIIASITIANLFAIRQKNLKRFFAFSSISQAGYIALGIISADANGMAAMLFYILVYLFANLAVFGVISVIEQKSGDNVGREDYNGLYKTNPRLSLIMTLALFSLGGIPPFAGFFSKFFIFMTAFEAGFELLVFIAIVNTVISLYYYLLVVKAMYITPNDAPIAPFKSDPYTRISLIVCLAGILLLGFLSSIYEGIRMVSNGL